VHTICKSSRGDGIEALLSFLTTAVERKKDTMRTSALPLALVAIVVSGTSNAAPSCQALISKISKGYQAAQALSPANKAAKCRAYALVTLDMDGIGLVCREGGDAQSIQTKIVPVARAMGADEQKYCGR